MPNHPPSRYLLVPPDFIVPSSTPLRLGAIPLISPLDPSCRHREPSAPPEVLDMYIFGLRKGDEQWECSKYKLYPISHDLGPAASTCVPIRCGSTSFPSATWSRGAAFNTVQLASGDHLALVIDEDDFIGAIMLFSNTDAPVGHVIGRLRIESPSPDMYVSLPDPAFDPVSGRICITDDCASILIMDYLLPRP